MAVAITAEGLSKRYQIGELQAAYGSLRESLSRGAKRLLQRDYHRHHEEIWALRDVSFNVREGEALGVVGRNGAGKSTLLKVLTRITTPTSGRAEIRGRVGSLLEVGTGFHPELTGRENVYLNGSILGMKRREITSKLPDIVEFAGIEKFMDTPVKRYSSGMYVRLAFSVAAHLEPEVMLVDEVLAVGDAEFQRRCLGRMEDLSESGRTVIFVSHNTQAISQLCDRAIWLDKGQIIQDGSSTDVVALYLQSGHGAGSSNGMARSRVGPRRRARTPAIGARSSTRVASSCMRSTFDAPVGVEIAYTVLAHGEPVFPKIKVYDARGDVAFNAMDTSPRWREPTPPGEYVSTAWIPANVLNEGLTTVDVSVCSLECAEATRTRGLLQRSVVPRPGPGRRRLCARPFRRPMEGRGSPAARVDDRDALDA